MLAVLSPGQGSQKPGFLTPWLDLPGAEARLRWWSALAGVDLIHLGTAADADEIKDTAQTQPLLVAAALLAAEHLPMYDVGLVAGHSVGELGAAALAGVLTAEAAITLAGVRGREMAAACALEPTGMSAVLGGDPDEVRRRDRRRTGSTRPTATAPARSSRPARWTRWTSSPPSRRPGPGSSRCRWPGAFHTPYMAPAETGAGRRRRRHHRRPTRPGSCCPTSTAPPSSTAARCCTAWSARSPRRCAGTCACARCADLGVTAVIELPPAGTLAGLIKRELKGDGAPEIVTLNTPDDLRRRARPDRPARHGARATSRPRCSGSWSRPAPARSSPPPASPRATTVTRRPGDRPRSSPGRAPSR